MKPVLCFGLFLLSFVYGFPTHLAPDENEERQSNKTFDRSFQHENITGNETTMVERLIDPCFLSTCIVHSLDSKLQPGDEIAGGLTNNPAGFGRK
ncbi:hypothetical protein MATL_G00263460 [Megalops atlanticus]|uniref:Uncharacterized protein n=1 Tax=Megalops atlanticus TaxID=7932 RepID=A0A9D3PDI9_MEGAT|nr:hypothetical protein MATL_G00263460 [Megalops atlanticus]